MRPPATETNEGVDRVVAFGRALRAEGLHVDAGRLADALAGLSELRPASPAGGYWPLRHALVSRREEIEVFDRLFAAWFLAAPAAPPAPEPSPPPPPQRRAQLIAPRPDEEGAAGAQETGGWSAVEILQGRDFAELSRAELRAVAGAIAELARVRPQRRTRRARPARSGTALDARRLLRSSLQSGGDPFEPAFRRRQHRPRSLVLLCDISGSMELYARPLLLFAHALVRGERGVEVFAFGTRLTRLTEDLARRAADESLALASARVVDWSGGTRIGASLRAFNDGWGRRAAARGAVVVIVSDGWEREDTAAVAREMERLSLRAYAVVWVNPLKGHPDYEPLAGGMRAALPYVDRFLAGNTLGGLEELVSVLAAIRRRHAV